MAGSNLRNDAVMEMRAKTPEPFLSTAEGMKSSSTMQTKPNGRFWVTNEAVNESMVKVGALGKAFVVVGAYQSFENIKSDGFSTKSIATEASVWGGAWVGGQIGAEAGAIGGPGGAFVGGIVGGIVGGMSAAMPAPDGSMPKPINMNQGGFNVMAADKLQIKQPQIK